MRMLAATAVVFLAACGGGSDKLSAAEWADRICEALRTPIERLESIASTTKAAEEGRVASDEQARQFVRDISTGFSTFLDSFGDVPTAVRSAGAPDAENGQKVQDTLVSQLDQGLAAMRAAAADIDDIDIDGVTLANLETTAGPALTKMGEGFESLPDLDEPDSAEIKKAIDDSTVCNEVEQRVNTFTS